MAATLEGWQHDILVRLQARDVHDKAYADLIDNCNRLAAQTVVLKERNRNLLKAAASTRSGSGSTNANGTAGGSDDNPVRQAYVASLESQLASLRDEVSTLYKTQAQNAQRLLHMTEQQRAEQERAAIEHTELIQLRSERQHREREREEARQLRKEKDKNIEVLQDELSMLRLEFDMIEKKNQALTEDNASLLRRWLEKKAQEAAEMDKMLEHSSKATP